jgi:hypothetical protein
MACKETTLYLYGYGCSNRGSLFEVLTAVAMNITVVWNVVWQKHSANVSERPAAFICDAEIFQNVATSNQTTRTGITDTLPCVLHDQINASFSVCSYLG